MMVEVFTMVAGWFGSFFGIYGILDAALTISLYVCVAIAFWSIVRFLVLPLVGGHYSIDDGESDILTESVTETVTTSNPKQNLGGGVYRRRTTTQTTTSTHRKKVK